ncbi:hypothetical protein [Kribbella deserti]|uniref:Uncharacterized protein n=1 Tax=Kribbella deserti TaxID=1926257 RepID=A0ABV6QGW5_9ACTN
MTNHDEQTAAAIIDPAGHVYTSWSDGYAVGFEVASPDGTTEYIYLFPSSQDDGNEATVFLYHGAFGDPDGDEPLHYYTLFSDQEPESGDDCDQDDPATDSEPVTDPGSPAETWTWCSDPYPFQPRRSARCRYTRH